MNEFERLRTEYEQQTGEHLSDGGAKFIECLFALFDNIKAIARRDGLMQNEVPTDAAFWHLVDRVVPTSDRTGDNAEFADDLFTTMREYYMDGYRDGQTAQAWRGCAYGK